MINWRIFATHPTLLPNFRIKLLTGLLFGIGIGIFAILILQINQDFAEYILLNITQKIVFSIAYYYQNGINTNYLLIAVSTLLLIGLVIIGIIKIYRFFLQIEWDLASKSALSELTMMSDSQDIKDIMQKGLLLLTKHSQADGAIALLQIDNVSTENIASFPENLLDKWVVPPTLFAKAIENKQCIYYPDYINSPNPSPILLAHHTKSLAILPLSISLPSNKSIQGAILLIWHRHYRISTYLQNFIQPLLNFLSLYLRIQTTTWELEKSGTKLSAILATISQGIIFIDASGEQGWVNAAAAKHLKVKAGNLTPHEISRAMANLRMQSQNAIEIAQQASQFFIDPDVKIDNWLWIYDSPKPLVLSVASTATCIRDVKGRLWVIDDVTESYSARKDLEIARDKAEVATRTKSIFLANMSHDIRTPMNAVIGLTNLLLDTKLTTEQREFLEIIRNSSDTLLVIINDILDFSKIEAGKMDLEAVSVNLHEFITATVSLFEKQALDKQLQFIYKIEPEVPAYILTDVTRLRQILFNLIGNAIKFTAIGKVTLLVSLEKLENIDSIHQKNSFIQDYQLEEDQYAVYYNFKESNSQSSNQSKKESLWLNQTNINPEDKLLLHFAIQDTGIGISQEGMIHLFESFSQVDGSKSRNYGGTGLGLAISNSLCKMMNGKIWVESQFNQGSIFHFTIQTIATTCPVNFEQAAVVKSADPKPKIPPKIIPKCSLNILVAEDNPTNQKIAYLYLKKLGYTADFADNGVHVLQAIAKKSYDLILMDMQMPEMDGLEATRKIRELERQTQSRRIRIIAMTANAMSEDREECINAGMDDHVSKPISLAVLQLTLDRCCAMI